MQFVPIIAALVALCGVILFLHSRRALAAKASSKRTGILQKVGLVMTILGVWLLIGCVLSLLFESPAPVEFSISIFPPLSGFAIGGYQPSQTMLVGWGVMAALVVGAVLLRVFFIPRMTDRPGRFQNVIETLVETVENYTSGQNVSLGRPMFGYIFTIGITLIGNVFAELMGFRSPSSDLMFTLALALSVFLMSNWYGIRILSVKGRLKGLARPSPLLLPIRIISDIVNPFSMACRLFGNTISGLIVMNLIYWALGSFAAGIPSVVGLYFNVFAALIQTIIFITLALSSIREATEEPED